MHHSLHVVLLTVMLDLIVRTCAQIVCTSSAVQHCMSAAGINSGCLYGIHRIVMLFVHTWRAQLLLFEDATGAALTIACFG